MNPLDWLSHGFLGNSLLAWGTGAGAALAAWGVLGIVRRVVRRRLTASAEASEIVSLKVAAHIAEQTKGWLLFVVAVFVGTRFWTLSPSIDTLVTRVATVALLVQLGLWATAAFLKFLSLRRQQQLTEDPGTVATLDVLVFVTRLGVWAIVLLLALDNLGVNITALVAGLGVGGVAVALAAQNILGDLFASLSIVLDKPFVIGDFLVLGDFMGSVEKVGIKTTRVRSLSGEQLVFSNNDLLSSRIRNYGRMFQRRVVFSLGVTYQTSAEQLKLIPKIIREAIEAQSPVRFDRAHFARYGDFALIFEVVYFVLSADYNLYMDIQQTINLRIYERFAEEGIEFAYPTQTLYVTGSEAQGGGRPSAASAR
jgi:small-conductance mechanosensitive channel